MWRLRPLRTRPSKIFEIILETRETPSRRMSLYVKIHESNLRATEEFRNLKSLWSHFRSSNEFRISKPLGLIDGLNAVVTAQVDGLQLSDMVQRSRILPPAKDGISALVSCVERAGNWLKFFHKTEVNQGTLAINYQASEPDNLMTAARRLDFPERLIIKATARLDRVKEAMRGSGLVVVHPDFTPEHVFFDQQAVSVIDFDILSLGPKAWNMARFCSYFDMMLLPLNMKRFSSVLKSRFVSAASDNRDSDTDELVNAFSTLLMLEKWVEINQKLRSHRAPNFYAVLPLIAGSAMRNIKHLCDNP